MRNWIAVFIMVLACCTSASAQTPVVTANEVVDAWWTQHRSRLSWKAR